MVEGLAIDIFGTLGIGLENDVGASLFEGFFERRILLFAEVGGDVFGAGDDASERKAGFGIGSDVIGDGLGTFIITDDDGAKGSFTTVFEGEIANKTDEAAEKTEEQEAGEGGIDGHDTDWEEIEFEEEIDGNDSHHTNKRGKKEAGDLSPAAAAQEDGFFVEAEAGENDDVNWDEREHGENETAGIGGEVERALVEMGAHEIGRQKGEDNRKSVP